MGRASASDYKNTGKRKSSASVNVNPARKASNIKAFENDSHMYEMRNKRRQEICAEILNVTTENDVFEFTVSYEFTNNNL